MQKLRQIQDIFSDQGLDEATAAARTVQTVLLPLIAQSSLQPHIAIKGGIVLQELSKNIRRSTKDIDLDVIRYPIEESAIYALFEKLDSLSEDFKITVASLKELKHQDYKGKRVIVRISDQTGYTLDGKLDIGVHTYAELEQENLVFELNALDERVTLLANTAEQIVAEKLKSLLRIGIRTTRYKDVYDIFFLLHDYGVDSGKLEAATKALIFEDSSMYENSFADIAAQMQKIFSNPSFSKRLVGFKTKWLDVDAEEVTSFIVNYFAF